MRKLQLRLILSFFFAATFFTTAFSQVVISQVYGAGSNSGALYTHDYIELFNRGTSPVSLNGWSLQYTSSTGTGNFGASATQITELPNVVLQPGQYFLVQQAGGSVGSPLPTADYIDPTPIAMAGGAGKIALVSS
ncbi:MAG: lamin tail domain-containing protein, partial [Chitinophagaceae bacterium]|nr:lamin tail domain-containing protein [Chitinophagaceae bacterium]